MSTQDHLTSHDETAHEHHEHTHDHADHEAEEPVNETEEEVNGHETEVEPTEQDEAEQEADQTDPNETEPIAPIEPMEGEEVEGVEQTEEEPFHPDPEETQGEEQPSDELPIEAETEQENQPQEQPEDLTVGDQSLQQDESEPVNTEEQPQEDEAPVESEPLTREEDQQPRTETPYQHEHHREPSEVDLGHTAEEHAAASKIQALHRGRSVRRGSKAKKIKKTRSAKAAQQQQEEQQPQESEQPTEVFAIGTDEEHLAASKIQALHRGRSVRRGSKAKKLKSRGSSSATLTPVISPAEAAAAAEHEVTMHEHLAAIRIQALQRGRNERKRHKVRKAERAASLQQLQQQEPQPEPEPETVPEPQPEAVEEEQPIEEQPPQEEVEPTPEEFAPVEDSAPIEEPEAMVEEVAPPAEDEVPTEAEQQPIESPGEEPPVEAISDQAEETALGPEASIEVAVPAVEESVVEEAVASEVAAVEESVATEPPAAYEPVEDALVAPESEPVAESPVEESKEQDQPEPAEPEPEQPVQPKVKKSKKATVPAPAGVFADPADEYQATVSPTKNSSYLREVFQPIPYGTEPKLQQFWLYYQGPLKQLFNRYAKHDRTKKTIRIEEFVLFCVEHGICTDPRVRNGRLQAGAAGGDGARVKMCAYSLATIAPLFHSCCKTVKYTMYYQNDFQDALTLISSVVGITQGENIIKKLQYLFEQYLGMPSFEGAFYIPPPTKQERLQTTIDEEIARALAEAQNPTSPNNLRGRGASVSPSRRPLFDGSSPVEGSSIQPSTTAGIIVQHHHHHHHSGQASANAPELEQRAETTTQEVTTVDGPDGPQSIVHHHHHHYYAEPAAVVEKPKPKKKKAVLVTVPTDDSALRQVMEEEKQSLHPSQAAQHSLYAQSLLTSGPMSPLKKQMLASLSQPALALPANVTSPSGGKKKVSVDFAEAKGAAAGAAPGILKNKGEVSSPPPAQQAQVALNRSPSQPIVTESTRVASEKKRAIAKQYSSTRRKVSGYGERYAAEPLFPPIAGATNGQPSTQPPHSPEPLPIYAFNNKQELPALVATPPVNNPASLYQSQGMYPPMYPQYHSPYAPHNIIHHSQAVQSVGVVRQFADFPATPYTAGSTQPQTPIQQLPPHPSQSQHQDGPAYQNSPQYPMHPYYPPYYPHPQYAQYPPQGHGFHPGAYPPPGPQQQTMASPPPPPEQPTAAAAPEVAPPPKVKKTKTKVKPLEQPPEAPPTKVKKEKVVEQSPEVVPPPKAKKAKAVVAKPEPVVADASPVVAETATESTPPPAVAPATVERKPGKKKIAPLPTKSTAASPTPAVPSTKAKVTREPEKEVVKASPKTSSVKTATKAATKPTKRKSVKAEPVAEVVVAAEPPVVASESVSGSELTEDDAAIKIQNAIRVRQAKKEVANRRHQLQEGQTTVANEPTAAEPAVEPSDSIALIDDVNESTVEAASDETNESVDAAMEQEEAAAVIIQSAVRQRHAKDKVAQLRAEKAAAATADSVNENEGGDTTDEQLQPVDDQTEPVRADAEPSEPDAPNETESHDSAQLDQHLEEESSLLGEVEEQEENLAEEQGEDQSEQPTEAEATESNHE